MGVSSNKEDSSPDVKAEAAVTELFGHIVDAHNAGIAVTSRRVLIEEMDGYTTYGVISVDPLRVGIECCDNATLITTQYDITAQVCGLLEGNTTS